MDDVVFQLRGTKEEYIRAQLLTLWYRVPSRIFYFVLGLAFVASIVAASCLGRNAEGPPACLLLLLWFELFLLAVPVCRAVQAGLLGYSKQEKGRIDYRLDLETLGATSPTARAEIAWEEFRSIRETRDFFFFELLNRTFVVIFKNSLDGQMIVRMRKLLQEVPILRKQLKY